VNNPDPSKIPNLGSPTFTVNSDDSSDAVITGEKVVEGLQDITASAILKMFQKDKTDDPSEY